MSNVARQDTVQSVPFDRVRFDALSDAVFGVAMTILAVELATHSNEYLDDYDKFWPRFVSFAASFFIASAFWVAHHNEIRFIERPDRILLWLNLLFLCFVVLIPFPAALLGANWHSESTIPTRLFAWNLFFLGASLQAVWLYARTLPETKTRASKIGLKWTTIRNFYLPVVSGLLLIELYCSFLGIDAQITRWVVSAVVPVYIAWTIIYRLGRRIFSGDANETRI
jgi:uncharacterized membrane protein